jgi:hypothetical protein
VPLVNLHTREVKVINFFKEEKEEKQQEEPVSTPE